MFSPAKPIRVISLDYDCLTTPAVLVESTLLLIAQLLKARHRLNASQINLLERYQECLNGLIGTCVALMEGSDNYYADDEAIRTLLKKFKSTLNPQELDVLKATLRSEAAEIAIASLDTSPIVIRYQNNLIKTLKADQQKYEETIVFIGSVRQSPHIDKAMAFVEDLLYSGKALQVIPRIAAKLNADYDGLTLRKLAPAEGEVTKGVIDTDRLLMLYYQVHKVATENAEDQIDFQYYSNIAEEMLGHEHGFMSVFSLCPDLLFPKQVKLHLRQFDARIRNESSEMIYADHFTSEGGIVTADSQYVDTLAEMIARAPMLISKEVPTVREIAVSTIVKNPFLPPTEIQAAGLAQIVHERVLRDLIRQGKLGLVMEGVLNLFTNYLKASTAAANINTNRYRFLSSLSQLLAKTELNDADKAAAFITLCRPLKIYDFCPEFADMASHLAKYLTPSMGGFASSDATVFAGAAGVVSGLASQFSNAAKLVRLLNYIVPNIIGGVLTCAVGGSILQLNGREYRVPTGLAKLFKLAISDKEASLRIAEIKMVLTKEGLRPPYNEINSFIKDEETPAGAASAAAHP
ncbi:MAG: hypothetical protein K0S29_701 [Gammaproteobacteria bacterium]|jgi:hypothetical protein|nr:hypothetical protein [Gammaproteobacteria bacterium]